MSVCSGSVYCKPAERSRGGRDKCVTALILIECSTCRPATGPGQREGQTSDADLKDTGDKTPGVTPCDSQLAYALRELFESALPVGVGVLLVRSALRTILPSTTAPVLVCC